MDDCSKFKHLKYIQHMTGKKSILQWMLGHKPLSINGISALQGIKYQSTGVIDLQTIG